MTIQAAIDEVLLSSGTYTSSAEGVVAVFDAMPQAGTQQGNLIHGMINLTPTTSGTAVTIRVRAGSTASGTLIGAADVTTVIATDPQSIPFAAFDSSVFPAGNQYCVTVKGTGAGGTVNDCVAFLDAISPTK